MKYSKHPLPPAAESPSTRGTKADSGKRWTKNGPLEVKGFIEIEDDMGSRPESLEHYTLCRCGGSKNMPFCDASHKTNGFDDEK